MALVTRWTAALTRHLRTLTVTRPQKRMPGYGFAHNLLCKIGVHLPPMASIIKHVVIVFSKMILRLLCWPT
eukprot:2264915-Pleurochrysis_carterae.AAC.1